VSIRQDVAALGGGACSKASKASPAAFRPGGGGCNDAAVGPPRPRLCSCSTPAARKGVAGRRGSHSCPAFPGICFASLAIVVVFPLPLTPTTRMTKRLAAEIDAERFLMDRLDRGGSTCLGKHTAEPPRVRTSWLKAGFGRSSSGHFGGDPDTHIAGNQQLFELEQRLIIEPAAVEDRVDAPRSAGPSCGAIPRLEPSRTRPRRFLSFGVSPWEWAAGAALYPARVR